MRTNDWTSKRLIAFLLLFALAYAQIAISSHAVVHSDHATHITASDTDHQDDRQHNKHECPECLLTKFFQSALTVDERVDINVSALSAVLIRASNDCVAGINCAQYNPRAPPAFLI